MEYVALVVIGLFAGVVGGMLGVGGSIVMIPAMTEVFGPDQHLYQAAAMIVNFFVVVPAVYQHRRAKAVDTATVLRLVPFTMVAVVVGVGVSELPLFAGEGEAYLRGLFGLFLLFVAVSDLYRLVRRSKSEPDMSPELTTTASGISNPARRKGTAIGSWRLAAAVAVPTGLAAGLLGVGGGILAVPLQRRLLRVPMRMAIANSAAIIIATSFVGAIAKNYAYVVDHESSVRSFALAAVLIPTAVLGSLIGSRLTHRLPLRVIKIAFFVFLLLAALRFTYKAAGSAREGLAIGPLPANGAQAESVTTKTPSRQSGLGAPPPLEVGEAMIVADSTTVLVGFAVRSR